MPKNVRRWIPYRGNRGLYNYRHNLGRGTIEVQRVMPGGTNTVEFDAAAYSIKGQFYDLTKLLSAIEHAEKQGQFDIDARPQQVRLAGFD